MVWLAVSTISEASNAIQAHAQDAHLSVFFGSIEVFPIVLMRRWAWDDLGV